MALLVVILPEHHRECMLRKGKGSDGVDDVRHPFDQFLMALDAEATPAKVGAILSFSIICSCSPFKL